jgi:replicative DNA helicase
MPEPSFDEELFLVALTLRQEDAKRFISLFKPDWLKNKELQPVLSAIYTFTKEFGTTPNLTTLKKVMRDEDPEKYEIRWKETLTRLETHNPEVSEQLYLLKQAEEVAVINSFQQMITNPTFFQNIEEMEGQRLLADVNRWIQKFAHTEGEGTLDIKSALEKLMDESGWQGKSKIIQTGISCIDEWSRLRTKHLAILMAPTGHGKSVVLMNIAHYISAIEEKRVLFLTNELTMSEQAERFLARMAPPIRNKDGGIQRYHTISEIQDDPSIAYHGLQRKWNAGFGENLLISSVNTDFSTDDIEADMMRWRNIHGWKPDVLVLDFMERMKPNDTGYRRDAEWQWYGAIAKDLSRLAKRHNMLVWTAAQTNRGGMNPAVALSMGHGQGSVRHFQEAAAVIGMRKIHVKMDVDGDVEIECLAFKELKQRHSAMSEREVNLMCDLRRMWISAEEVIPPSIDAVSEGEATPKDPKQVKGPRATSGYKKP